MTIKIFLLISALSVLYLFIEGIKSENKELKERLEKQIETDLLVF